MAGTSGQPERRGVPARPGAPLKKNGAAATTGARPTQAQNKTSGQRPGAPARPTQKANSGAASARTAADSTRKTANAERSANGAGKPATGKAKTGARPTTSARASGTTRPATNSVRKASATVSGARKKERPPREDIGDDVLDEGEVDQPLGRQHKNNNALIWAVCMTLTVLFVGAAIFLLFFNNGNSGGGGKQSPKVRAILTIGGAGSFDDPSIKESGIDEWLTPDMREKLKRETPQWPAGVPLPKTLLHYKNSIAEKELFERHVFMGNMRFSQLQLDGTMKTTEDLGILAKLLVDQIEFAVKVRAIMVRGLDSLDAEPKVRELIETQFAAWVKWYNHSKETKTNRKLGQAKDRLTANKESEDYRRFKKAETVYSMLTNNYTIEDYRQKFPDDYELIKDYEPEVTAEPLEEFRRDSANFIQYVAQKAGATLDEESDAWDVYAEAVNAEIDRVLKLRDTRIKQLRELVQKAEVEGDDNIERMFANLDEERKNLLTQRKEAAKRPDKTGS